MKTISLRHRLNSLSFWRKRQPAVSTITVEMITHYQQFLILQHSEKDYIDHEKDFGNWLNWLSADPMVSPFVCRFYQSSNELASAAYLSVVDGSVVWRYARKNLYYAHCPVGT